DINRAIYVPFTTMSDLKDTHYLDSIWFNYETPEYEKLELAARDVLSVEHKFSRTDRRAVRVFNLMEQVHQFQVITIGLKILLGFIGTLTLGIGGVGLMNIMLVSVTRRPAETGGEKGWGGRGRHTHALPFPSARPPPQQNRRECLLHLFSAVRRFNRANCP